MKRILPLLVVGIFVLSGLGAVALPYEKESLHTEDWELEIAVKGGLLGYTVGVMNVGNESVNGNFSINITTEASFMFIGNELGTKINEFDFEPGKLIEFKIKPVIGFGPALINIYAVFETEDGGYDTSAVINGFVFLFIVLCMATPIYTN